MIVGWETIENTASLVSAGPPPTFSLIRTRQFADGVFGTSQSQLPSFGVEAMIVVQFVPPSTEYSILTSPTVGWTAHVMR